MTRALPTDLRSTVVPASDHSNGDGRTKRVIFETLGDPFVIERKKYIVSGLLGAGEVVVIHADTKVGKTQLASHLSFCVAAGMPFFGRTVMQGAVLYMALEKGPVTRKRFRALQRIHDGIRPPVGLSTTPINLLTARDVQAVIAAANELAELHGPVSLIVVDTLNRAIPGIDENAAGPVGEAFNALTQIAERTRAAIVLLHHNVKGSGKLRGSSVIAASVDVVISLEKVDDDVLEAVVTAANDAPEGQTFRFRMPVVEIAPASASHEADTTVVIEPFNDDGDGYEAGAAHKRAPVAAKADRDRAARILSLIERIATDGRCAREHLLGEARNQEIVSPLNPKSGAEQLRKALMLLSNYGSLTYTDREVHLAPRS